MFLYKKRNYQKRVMQMHKRGVTTKVKATVVEVLKANNVIEEHKALHVDKQQKKEDLETCIAYLDNPSGIVSEEEVNASIIVLKERIIKLDQLIEISRPSIMKMIDLLNKVNVDYQYDARLDTLFPFVIENNELQTIKGLPLVQEKKITDLVPFIKVPTSLVTQEGTAYDTVVQQEEYPSWESAKKLIIEWVQPITKAGDLMAGVLDFFPEIAALARLGPESTKNMNDFKNALKKLQDAIEAEKKNRGGSLSDAEYIKVFFKEGDLFELLIKALIALIILVFFVANFDWEYWKKSLLGIKSKEELEKELQEISKSIDVLTKFLELQRIIDKLKQEVDQLNPKNLYEQTIVIVARIFSEDNTTIQRARKQGQLVELEKQKAEIIPQVERQFIEYKILEAEYITLMGTPCAIQKAIDLLTNRKKELITEIEKR